MVPGDSAAGKTQPAFKTVHIAIPFAGAYVNEVYVDSIAKNRSPRKDQMIEACCIDVPDSTLKPTSMIANFHEGGEDRVIIKDGDRYQFYDAALQTPRDTIELVAPERLRIGSQFFRKLRHADKDKWEWGILNELLLGGRYQTEDGRQVVLEMDGRITGLDTVTYYQPHADYIGDQDIGADRISIGLKQKLHDYGFQFDKDTLRIYSIDIREDSVSGDHGDEELGALKWKLIRIRR
jgi:hypothetical protein